MVRPTAVLTCYRTRRRIDAYLDGALAARDARATATHLSLCSRCQAHADTLRRLQAMVRRSLEAPHPLDWTGFWEGIVRGIQDRRVEHPATARPMWRRPRFAFGMAVAAMLLASVALWQMPPAFLTRQAEAAVVVSSADTDHPRGTVMVYSPPEKDLAIVWVFDLD